MSELALALFAGDADVHATPGATRTARFASFLRRFDERAARETLARAGVRWLGRSEPGFPARLAAIHDPPPGLFVRGSLDPVALGGPLVAVVGARACTDYGAHVARTLGRELAAAGVVVVSGLARGIDGWAHRGAIEGGGHTIAVLGCGIDRDYPRAHGVLAEQVRAAGLVVSEYPPGVAPAPWRFPARNRIVAGISLATVVIEARERSGALITADLAMEEGRDVLAVPGEITSALSRGSNALLQLGATPVLGVRDILDAIGVENPDQGASALPDAGSTQARVLDAVGRGAATADEISRVVDLPPGAVAAALVELELSGHLEIRAGIVRR